MLLNKAVNYALNETQLIDFNVPTDGCRRSREILQRIPTNP